MVVAPFFNLFELDRYLVNFLFDVYIVYRFCFEGVLGKNCNFTIF